MKFDWLLGTDTQHEVAASRQLLRAGQRQRWASLSSIALSADI